MEDKQPGTSFVVVSMETRIVRSLVEKAIADKAERITYDEVAKELGKSPKDKKVRSLLRLACRYWSDRMEGVDWDCEHNSGFRRMQPKETADMLSGIRRKSIRATRRGVKRAINLTRNATLSEDDQKRLFIEMSSASAIMTIGSASGAKRIAAGVQSQELPPAEVLRLFTA